MHCDSTAAHQVQLVHAFVRHAPVIHSCCLQVCLGAVTPSPGWGHWMGQLSGMQGAMNGLRYINCCARQLGELVRPVSNDSRPLFWHVLSTACSLQSDFLLSF